MTETRTFNLSIVMAGAVSGGAYQGGVMDFIIQALDAWEAARGAEIDGVPVPDHAVVLQGLAGASAGSFTAAAAAAALSWKFPPAADVQAEPKYGSKNPFFEAWVNRVDIDDLLQTQDFTQSPADAPEGRRVLSLLDCTAIDRAVTAILDIGRANDDGEATQRGWVSDKLGLRMALGNLRGIPYSFQVGHGSRGRHYMTAHADYRDFRIIGRGSASACETYVNFVPVTSGNSSAAWADIGQAAKASAAFPFALRPRLIKRKASEYTGRVWVGGSDEKQAVPHEAPPDAMPDDYQFMAMDGGIMNNEPIELGRALLLKKAWEHNPRKGSEATAAVVLIDPFLENGDISSAAQDVPLMDLVVPLLSAWKAQCRFKPGELDAAADEDVFSRFLIAPQRSLPDTVPDGADLPHPLASGGLGAFLGFFDREFRKHDFQLGRRNAQQFLRIAFAVPLDNKIVEPWVQAVCADPAIKAKALELGWLFVGEDGIEYVALIPLMPVIRGKIAEADWPAAPDPKSYRARMERRLDRVIQGLIRESGMNLFERLITKGAWAVFGKPKVLEKGMDVLTKAFKAQCFR